MNTPLSKLLFFLMFSAIVNTTIAQNTEIYGPPGSENFGGLTVLPNGNYVVTDPLYDDGPVVNVGAVYLYNGSTHTLISMLKGSSANDRIGSTSIGIVILTNGNYVVTSANWKIGGVSVGAVTWCSATTGLSGVINSSNSLVGSTYLDMETTQVVPLANGNYVVANDRWDNGTQVNAGAATWGNGTTGVSGVISSTNSFVGSNSVPVIGRGVTALTNGNYVVSSLNSATWCDGTIGRTGNIINSSNSLIGSGSDNFGNPIIALSNGNYVVVSTEWENGIGGPNNVGAITWCNGTTGRTGFVTAANSFIGSKAEDRLGYAGIYSLNNGNYVVLSSICDNGSIVDAGAATWFNGSSVTTGSVSIVNSLMGGTTNDYVGENGITLLNNGNYTVNSPYWNNGAVVTAGAVTFCVGTAATTGVVSSINSLVGNTSGDNVGILKPIALSNGHYVVPSNKWDNGSLVDAGAVTWGNGTTGTFGVVSAGNSLVGTTANDKIGFNDLYSGSSVAALSNGNYVVGSPHWDNGVIIDGGAATWCDGSSPTSAAVTITNSLRGSKNNDYVGIFPIALSNGNYVVNSIFWNGAMADSIGAVTWCNGTGTTSAIVTSTNSLIGNNNRDMIGFLGIKALSGGRYYVLSRSWDNGPVNSAGATTMSSGSSGIAGNITSCNSVLGNAGVGLMVADYNEVYDYLIVGKRAENTVVIYNPSSVALTNNLDQFSVNIGDTSEAQLVTNSGCRIAGSLKPLLTNPVSGTINIKTWIESSVPVFGPDPFVARHIEITPANNASTSTGRVTLYFTQQEFTDFNNHPSSVLDLPTGPADAAGKANLRISKFGGTSNDGTGLPGSYSGTREVINPNDADIVWSSLYNRWEVGFDVTGFSGFFVQTSPYILPLTLLEFNGQLQNDNAVLIWKTTNEINVASFDIERSLDGRIYTSIAIAAAANQPGNHLYNYTDRHITSLGVSVVYYRLKQKDINGQVKYSATVALSIDKNRNIVMLYPNPVISNLSLTITTGNKELVNARIIDNTGRVIRTLQWNLQAGSTTLSVDLKNIAKGIYYLELMGKGINERKQFIKQ